MTSKERAYLRGLANGIRPIFQIGKGGLTPELTISLNSALEARELIKVSVLDTSPMLAGEAAQIISERIKATIVQVIGSKFVLYRAAKKNPTIVLPK